MSYSALGRWIFINGTECQRATHILVQPRRSYEIKSLLPEQDRADYVHKFQCLYEGIHVRARVRRGYARSLSPLTQPSLRGFQAYSRTCSYAPVRRQRNLAHDVTIRDVRT